MKITPLGNRAYIKEDEKEKVSSGGIIIPPTAKDGKLTVVATVISVGPGKLLENGSIREPNIKAGDRVVIGKYQGTNITIEGDEYRIVDIDLIEGLIVEDGE